MHRPAVDEAKVGLMDKGCTLQGVITALASEALPRHTTEFFVDEGDQFFSCTDVPLSPSN